MMYANDQDGRRIETAPGLAGSCPGCGKTLIARCGEINAWHWSHKVNKDCDKWFEHETAWHIWWKRQVKEEYREVVLPPHRADICVPGRIAKRLVIELQHSTIDPQSIRDREKFYCNMLWLFDAAPFANNISFRAKFKEKDDAKEWEAIPDDEKDEADKVKRFRKEASHFTFRWKHPRKSLFEVSSQIFFDLSNVPYYYDNPLIFHVRKLHPEVPCGGWGVFMTRDEFIKTWIPEQARA